MNNLTLKFWLALFLAGVAQAGVAAPIPTAPVYTNRARFRIPFRYDPVDMQNLGAREVRLFVSRDRGITWQLNQAVPPDAGRFQFQAPSDGEYWFVVRTLDTKDRLHPDGPMLPGLQVVVDTVPPQFKLELRQPAPGRVQLAWQSLDDFLDVTQLRLEYIQPNTPQWSPVSVVPKSSGMTEWSIPQGGAVSVRGSIADLAKNTAQDEVQLNVAPGEQVVPAPRVPDFRQPIAQPGGNSGGNMAMALPDRSTASASSGQHSILQPEPANKPAEPIQFEPIRSPAITATPVTGGSGARNGFVTHGAPGAASEAGSPVDNSKLVTGRYRIVSQRQFQIGYKLQDVGPSGVSVVELFITPDDGANWYKYGEDSDGQSPAQIEVPREGTYGFALGVRSGVGLGGDPPQVGEKPSMVVVVDQTPPRVELLPLEQGRGRASNKLQIKWVYADQFPADKPVSISYATGPQGPWQPITGWHENTGSCIWTIGPGVPSRFYVRLEARDAAGNVSLAETPQPVLIDLSRPTARIIDVEAPGASSGPQ